MSGAVVTLAKTCIAPYFAGIGRTHVVMICDVFGLVINVPPCYAMVFGKPGFPELGIAGTGVSTVVSSVLAFLLFVFFYFRKEHRNTLHHHLCIRIQPEAVVSRRFGHSMSSLVETLVRAAPGS